jgi:hypothetical protein
MSSDLAFSRWYSSDEAKRRFGWICQAVNENAETIGLLGSENEPLLWLIDVDKFPTNEVRQRLVEITIEEAQKNWSAVTSAALFLGVCFLIKGKKVERAVLVQHETNKHKAFKYSDKFHAQSLLKGEKTISEKLDDIFDGLAEIQGSIKALTTDKSKTH